MTDAPSGEGLPPSLRLLKLLVIVLMLVMIGGVITIVGLIVTRLPAAKEDAPPAAHAGLSALPAALQMPQGAQPEAVTFGKGWIAVVTQDDRILVFTEDGALQQELQLAPLPEASSAP
ncbi:DUF6476 family protein [Xinfangfangia sp. CPCC 101601]|uniref:DUF6476 family protein n=1 Tax=Pseudogemmobacter lacusdianii TaxID=3069608 RepID=A0ABU0VX82_9RHOB|nr:DUF6476 family protein [Xinfangfangia sp. CPCC 101601]MDQ2065800.1 DUF6476 family protein [Xinfangfangia sp. CPCC 101601]